MIASTSSLSEQLASQNLATLWMHRDQKGPQIPPIYEQHKTTTTLPREVGAIESDPRSILNDTSASPTYNPPSKSPSPTETRRVLSGDVPFPDDLLDVAKTLEQLKSNEISDSPSSRKRASYELKDDSASSSSNEQSMEVGSPPMSSKEGDLSIKTKPKKRRRKRDEIERSFKCPVAGCTKSYGSEGALKTHVKLKHSPDASLAASNSPVFTKKPVADISWQKGLTRTEPKLINGTPSSIPTPQLPPSLQALGRTTTSPVSNISSSTSTLAPISSLLSAGNTNSIHLPLPTSLSLPNVNGSSHSSMSNNHPILPPLSSLAKGTNQMFYSFMKEPGVQTL